MLLVVATMLIRLTAVESTFASIAHNELAVLLSNKDSWSTKRATVAILNSAKLCNMLLMLLVIVTMLVRDGQTECGGHIHH